MVKILFIAIGLLFSMSLNARSKGVHVFISGQEGYKSFRIPAIIGLPDGTFLAFAEGRVNGAGDFGNNDIVMKKSTDKGRTWSALKVVAEYGDLQTCNPAPVVDLTDPEFPEGRLFLFYNTGNSKESDLINGKGIKYCLYKTSVDGGETWSEPVDITLQVHRPNQPSVNPQFSFAEDWRYYANTPGHAMQFQSGKFKGRIFVAANHSAGGAQKGAEHYQAHGYYTDDHGKTFTIGNSVNIKGSNESMAAELSESRLIMNSRNQKGNIRTRIVSFSSDGGKTWDTTYFDGALIDPVCQASILSLDKKNGKNIIAFCNAADTINRNNLTLRISYDEGKTWVKDILVYKNSDILKPKYAYTAYSDLIRFDKRRIGILYERDNYASIIFVVVKWK